MIIKILRPLEDSSLFTYTVSEWLLTRRADDLFDLGVFESFTPAQIQQPEAGQSGRGHR